MKVNHSLYFRKLGSHCFKSLDFQTKSKDQGKNKNVEKPQWIKYLRMISWGGGTVFHHKT